jgi:hypothetical protein
MKKIILPVLMICLLFFFSFTLRAQTNPFQYVSPKPSSILVSVKTNIILKYGENLDKNSLNTNLFTVEGSKSGLHSGELLLSDDNKTIVFNPEKVFDPGELVTVTLKSGIRTILKTIVPEYSFSFQTLPESSINYSASNTIDLPPIDQSINNTSSLNKVSSYLPAPPIKIDSINNPSKGYIFLATWDRNIVHVYGNYLFLLDSQGNIVDSMRVNGAPFDFQVQPNGLLSYALGDFAGSAPLTGDILKHYIMDSTYAVIDSFQMKNGYDTDFHEFHLLPNGHAMMMSFHNVTYDMSKIVPNGNTNATLVIDIIQEQDKDKNVVFEWRDIDYMPITETDAEDLTLARVHPRTVNAFDLDNDGNILVSCRELSAILKISRETGEIMWRMGKGSDFTYINEHPENAPYYHARQHNVKRLPNGDISIFDNGEFHNPPYSRGVEYKVDEVNKTATLVSEFRYPNGNIFTATAGNAEKLPNGGWFIGYGALHPLLSPVKRNAVESHADGTIAFELSLPPNILAYRVSKFPWKELVKINSVYNDTNIDQGNTVTFTNSTDTTGVKIKFVALTGDPAYKGVVISRVPYGPINSVFSGKVPIVYPVSVRYDINQAIGIYTQQSEFHIDLTRYPEIKDPSKTSVYMRDEIGMGNFDSLATDYDVTNKELIFTTTKFGEFVFGETDIRGTANTPYPFEPERWRKVLSQNPVKVSWSGKGMFDSFEFQLSIDSLFVTTNIDSTLNDATLNISNLNNNTKYYWRVRSKLDTAKSDWSTIWSFETTDPFIDLNNPDGGEILKQLDSVVVRWTTNILDSVEISLFKNSSLVQVIDLVDGTNEAYRWIIPTSVTTGSGYKIQVKSLKDPAVIDTSNASFSIDYASTIETINNTIPNDYSLFQNYPNPFNPSTTIKFDLKEAGLVSLKIYDILGREISTLVNEVKPAGSYNINFNADNLTSGVYFYQFKAGEFVQTRKMILMK